MRSILVLLVLIQGIISGNITWWPNPYLNEPNWPMIPTCLSPRFGASVTPISRSSVVITAGFDFERGPQFDFGVISPGNSSMYCNSFRLELQNPNRTLYNSFATYYTQGVLYAAYKWGTEDLIISPFPSLAPQAPMEDLEEFQVLSTEGLVQKAMTVRNQQYIFMSRHFLCKDSNTTFFPNNGTSFNESMNMDLTTDSLWIVTTSNYLLISDASPGSARQIYTDYGNCSLTPMVGSFFPDVDFMSNGCWWEKDSTLYFISGDGNFTRCEITPTVGDNQRLIAVSFSCRSTVVDYRVTRRGAQACWTTGHYHYMYQGVSAWEEFGDIWRFQDDNGCQYFTDDYLYCINGQIFYPGNWDPYDDQTIPTNGNVTVNGTINLPGGNGTINVPVTENCNAGTINGNGNVTGNGTLVIGVPTNLNQTCNITIISWNGTFDGNLNVTARNPDDPSNCLRNTTVTGTRTRNGYTITLSSTVECHDESSSSSLESNTSAILGGVLGGFFLMSAVVALTIFILRYRTKSKQNAAIQDLELQKWTLTDVHIASKLEGAVYNGTWLKTPVACKSLRGDEPVQRLDALKRLNHPNIVQYLGIYQDQVLENAFLVMEKVKGKLGEYLSTHKDMIRELHLVDMCIQACAGMAYLSKEGILHGELALENCLYADGDIITVKLSHFGTPSFTKGPTVRHDAPEILNGGKPTEKSEVFAMGLLLWQIWSFGDKLPYTGDDQDIELQILRGDLPDRPEACPQDFWEGVIFKCWDRDPSNRPSFEELLELWEACRKSREDSSSEESDHSLEVDRDGEIYQ